MERVTVIIPTFRRGAAVGRTVSSALAQEDVDVHVILVDDGSGDGSREQLSRLVTPQVQILDQPVNAGGSAARQRATELAQTRVVAYLDDDDVWEPTHLQGCLDAMQRAGSRWAYGGVTWVDASLTTLHEQPLVDARETMQVLLRGNALVTPSAIVAERDLVLEVGGWDPGVAMFGDWDLVLRLADRSVPAAGAAATVRYVRHDGSLSRTALEAMPAELAMLRAKHAELARRHGGRIGTAHIWRLMGYEYRASGARGPSARAFLRAAVADRRPDDALRAIKVLARG